jgi:hypothetical protein
MTTPNDYDWDGKPGTRPDPDADANEAKVQRRTVRQFREQIHALGALWIIIGLVNFGLAALALNGNKDMSDRIAGEYEVLVIVIAVLGALWLILGIATCFKQMWAVYTALALTYLSLVGNAINLNVISVIIAVIVILQAHRVIGWARQLRAAGVSLTARPN